MVTKTIQLAAIAVAAVLFGAMAAVSFASSGNTQLATNDEQSDVLADIFALQYADAAQVDYFLKVEGIEGEATHAGHQKEIDVLSWSWGVSQSGSSSGGGGGAGRATFTDITVVKTLDKSSPKLFLACASGQHIEEVKLAGSTTLTADRKDTKSQDYFIITLKDVLVSSYQQSGQSGDSLPTESISFNFAEIKVEYKPRNPDGSLGDTISAGWNVKENKGA